MGAMSEVLPEASAFLCRFNIPIRLDEDRHQYVPVFGIFRRIPYDQLDRWVMQSDGRPRTDRDLAAEVLLELRRPLGPTGKTAPLHLSVREVIEFDRAATIIVATFLAELPREASEEAGLELGRVA
ncbi:hypothetical protein H7F35_25425 [Variovorax sp. PAMC26660]|nr:hypothetical protein H7F35_25425 [Variovorax sp. PAMC26660]